jgi:DNA-binding FrmR family transcriptional regulator
MKLTISNEQDQRKIISRLNRIVGQLRAVEKLILSGEQDQVIVQLQAITGACQSAMAQYVGNYFSDRDKLSDSDHQLLQRLLKKVG